MIPVSFLTIINTAFAWPESDKHNFKIIIIMINRIYDKGKPE